MSLRIELNRRQFSHGEIDPSLQFSSVHEPCPADVSRRVKRDWLISSTNVRRGVQAIQRGMTGGQIGAATVSSTLGMLPGN
jgi:hypothetical protein